MTPKSINRRDFIKTMGSGLASAGVEQLVLDRDIKGLGPTETFWLSQTGD